MPCCDLCALRQDAEDLSALSDAQLDLLRTLRYLEGHIKPKPKPQVKAPRRKAGYGAHKGLRKKQAQKTLEKWRNDCSKMNYTYYTFDDDVLWPENIIKTLAKLSHLETVDDIKRAVPMWGFANDHSQEIINLLLPTDEAFQNAANAQTEENHSLKEQKTAKEKFEPDETECTHKEQERHNEPMLLLHCIHCIICSLLLPLL